MSDEPLRVSAVPPDASLVDRLWFALGVPSQLVQLGLGDDDQVRMAATIGERSRRLQFVTEDWAMERGFREDAEALIVKLAEKYPDDTDLTGYVRWMEER